MADCFVYYILLAICYTLFLFVFYGDMENVKAIFHEQ